VGSLRDRIRAESLTTFITDNILSSDNPVRQLRLLAKTLQEEVFSPALSAKHMAGRELGRLESTPALKYKVAV